MRLRIVLPSMQDKTVSRHSLGRLNASMIEQKKTTHYTTYLQLHIDAYSRPTRDFWRACDISRMQPPTARKLHANQPQYNVRFWPSPWGTNLLPNSVSTPWHPDCSLPQSHLLTLKQSPARLLSPRSRQRVQAGNGRVPSLPQARPRHKRSRMPAHREGVPQVPDGPTTYGER